jgi:hypothetical protein
MNSGHHSSARQKQRAGRSWLVLAIASVLALGAGWAAAQPAAAQEPVAEPGQTVPPPEGTPLFLPLVAGGEMPSPTPVPTLPARSFGSIQVQGGSLGWPADASPDVNLAWRGFVPTSAYPGLVNYNGDTDEQAPQMAAIFAPPRLPAFGGAYQVYDWDWACNPPWGCRGQPLSYPYAVTLLEMATVAGEPLAIAARSPSIYADYKAMVLYAEERRLTITYTHDDSPANGYMLHFEDVAVAPELIALYRQLDAAGRRALPALRNGEVWGMAAGLSVKVAVRDRGTFMDPRACKDWWMDYRSQCVVQLQRPPSWRPQGGRP